MFDFWLIAVLLLLAPLFIILLTLLKTQENEDVNKESNAELYEQHLLEIEQDIENGLLNKTEAKIMKKELQISLLNQADNKQETKRLKESNSAAITAIVLLLAIPFFAIGMYQYLGQPELIEKSELLAEFQKASTQEEKMASVEKMLSSLEQRMINHPDDIDGWLMLTNSYTVLERYPDALRAVANLYRLRSEDPTVLLRYADILSRNNGGIYAGKPTELINESLRLAPGNPNGLWFAGLAANERGDIEQAINYWQQLVPKLEEGSEQQQQVQEFIEMISQNIEGDQSMPATKSTNQQSEIVINVSLSDNLIQDVSNNDTVFIYAQAISGPPMPIAVVRKKVRDLPLQVKLNDSMAMIPSNKLSDHEQVKLTARISKSGDAIAESGDLIGTINSIETRLNEPTHIIISQKVP